MGGPGFPQNSSIQGVCLFVLPLPRTRDFHSVWSILVQGPERLPRRSRFLISRPQGEPPDEVHRCKLPSLPRVGEAYRLPGRRRRQASSPLGAWGSRGEVLRVCVRLETFLVVGRGPFHVNSGCPLNSYFTIIHACICLYLKVVNLGINQRL